MSKINILKGKIHNRRAGQFSYRKYSGINLTVQFPKLPEFEKKLINLLHKYFTVIDLNQNSNKKSRGSVSRSKRYTRSPQEKKI